MPIGAIVAPDGTSGATLVLTPPSGRLYTVAMEINNHGVAQMDAYRKPSLVVSPDQLLVFRYVAATAWEGLRQEGRRRGLVWFDSKFRVVPDFQRRHGPDGAQLITVAIGVVHDSSYTDRNGFQVEHVAEGRMQVSVQFPKGKTEFPALWISDFDATAGPTENDPYHCEAVDWHSPLRKETRK